MNLPRLLLIAMLALGAFAAQPAPTEAHSGVWTFSRTCSTYTVKLAALAATGDVGPHRVIVTKNDRVVAVVGITNAGSVSKLYVETGTLPLFARFEAFVYSPVGGSYAFGPRIGDVFNAPAGYGLVNSSQLNVGAIATCVVPRLLGSLSRG